MCDKGGGGDGALWKWRSEEGRGEQKKWRRNQIRVLGGGGGRRRPFRLSHTFSTIVPLPSSLSSLPWFVGQLRREAEAQKISLLFSSEARPPGCHYGPFRAL